MRDNSAVWKYPAIGKRRQYMKVLRRLPFLVLALLFTFGSASGEMLTLEQAVRIALSDNPGLKSYRWTVEAEKENLNAAKGNLYPKFTIEERYQRTDNPTYGFMAKLNQERFTQADFAIDSLNNPDDISDFQTSIGFEQPLFVPGLYKGIGIAKNELGAQEAMFLMKKEGVILRVIQSFHKVQTAAEYAAAAREGIDDAREHRRLASLRYDAGTGLYSDVLRAEAAHKKAEALLVKAQGDREVARRSLGLLLGRTEPVDAADSTPHLTLHAVETYLGAALQREDLKALRLRYESSQEAVALEKSAFLPEIGLGGSYLMNDQNDPFSPEGESYLLMGFLKWNFFDASAYHKIKKAKAKVHESSENVVALEQEIQFRVHEAYTRIKEKEQTLALARAILEEAGEALRLVRARYENALAPMIDLLDTQVMLNTARAQLVEAENEYGNAMAVLYYQSGMLSETFIQNQEF
jgi:outer membrane protein TolC